MQAVSGRCGSASRRVPAFDEWPVTSASRPLQRIPAIVSFLNPQPAFRIGGGNHSSFPLA